jgi:ABC-type sugar transport system substrate-binding protein
MINRRQFLAAGALAGLEGCRQSTGGGTRWRLGLSSPHETEILSEFYANMKRAAAQIGNIQLIIVDSADDPVKQFTDIEAFVAQKFDGVFFLVPRSEGMDDIVSRAVADGIYMFNHSASPITGCTQNVILDQFSAGYKVGECAARWLRERHGGRAAVGYLTNRTDPQLAERSRGLKEGVAQNCPGSTYAGEVEAMTVDAGAAGAANLLQAHPDIRVLLALSDDPGFGAYTAALEAGHKDPNEFFVGSADGTQLVYDRLAEGGIYQGCASFFFSFSATQWVRDMVSCLQKRKVPPTRIMGSKLVTRETLGEFQRIAANPLGPDNQKYYNDPAIMRYSDQPLQTPNS